MAGAARGALTVGSLLFGVGGGLRRRAYDAGWFRAHSAQVPVISVGNLTAGGTGKTPLVIHMARELASYGETVGVLARGYGARHDGDLNDELKVVKAEAPEARLFPGKNRVVRAAEAVAAGVSVIVLDDGFQHRRLARDLDVVVLDATEPWGEPPGKLLPRGLLREPPAVRSRADVVVLSRVELVGPKDLEALEAEVRSHGFNGPVLRMLTQATKLSLLALAEGAADPGERLDQLGGLPLVAACGIGNPTAFGATLASLGARASQLVAMPDHHVYVPWDVEHFEKLAERRAVTRIVVTEKDAVKLRGLLDGPRSVTWQALGIQARLEPADALRELWAGVKKESLHATEGDE